MVEKVPTWKAVQEAFQRFGLDLDATADDVRKRYHKLSRMTHPDKGGSTTAFQQLGNDCSAIDYYLENASSFPTFRSAPNEPKPAPSSCGQGEPPKRKRGQCPFGTRTPQPGQPRPQARKYKPQYKRAPAQWVDPSDAYEAFKRFGIGLCFQVMAKEEGPHSN